MKIRNSGINPFLLNPIKALVNNEDVGINHALSTICGLIVMVEYKDGKSGSKSLNDIEFLNRHEYERFKMMLKMLGKKYINEKDLASLD